MPGIRNPAMWVMRDSNVANAAKESAQDEFPHGLQEFCAAVCDVRFTYAPCKGGAFQWVQAPPGETLQPEATGAVMEVTKWLKPSV